MLIDELLTFLFDGQPHLLSTPMATWLASSRRFTAFVNTFHNKIRKKLRATQEMERLLDLCLELETAYLLLQEGSISLVYEPPTGEQSRGPDFAVTYTTSTLFMVEVTRGLAQAQELQPVPQAAPIAPPIHSIRSLAGEWLAEMVCSKLSQLLPKHTNILLVGVETPCFIQDTLRAIMLNLQQRAERNDAAIVQRNGFRDRAHF